MVDGFLLDVTYEPPRDRRPGQAIVWLKDDRGQVHRVPEPFTPTLYVQARDPQRLDALESALPPGAGKPWRTRARCGLGERDEDVLAVPVNDARRIQKVAQQIDAAGSYRDYELLDVDLRFSHRWFVAKGLFPFARVRCWTPGRYRLLDDQRALDYPDPQLRVLALDARPDCPRGAVPGHETPLREARVGERVLQGQERDVLQAVHEEIRAQDPDVILTRGGDTFLLPYLYARADANGVELVLGREKQPREPRSKGKSFFTYGRIKYRAPDWSLLGRTHVDRVTSFFYSEAGLHGLVDLSRVARVPLQEMARLGAGTAVTAIQIDLAKSEGRLIPWKKNAPEQMRSARALLLADRGGYIREPHVGLHDDVVELDFASLYPNIMVRRNISPEMILCECCAPPQPEESLEEGIIRAWRERMRHRIVPQLETWTCARRSGFIPRALAPVIERREHFKRMRKRDPDRRSQHQERVDVYKWMLVTSFGYQGYKNAKFGRIECHEAIGAWGREILLSAGEVAREFGFHAVHGIVDSLWLARDPNSRTGLPTADLGRELSNAVSEEVGIPFEYEGRYKWIVFLPNRHGLGDAHTPAVGALNRYYGCFDAKPDKPNRSQPGQPIDHLADGTLKVRGIEYRQHSTPPILREVQRRFLEALAPAQDAAEVVARLPEAMDSVAPVLERVRRGEAGLEEMVFTNSVSRTLEEYRANTMAHAAVRQLHRAGVAVEPGQSVRYVVLERKQRDPGKRVVEARLMTGREAYDAAHYEAQALRALASLTLPFGWDEAKLAERYRAGAQLRLGAWRP